MWRQFSKVILLVIVAGQAAGTLAQSFNPDGTESGWTYRVNFAIPDAPAFELLKVDPSTILRPQNSRELAVALSDFRSANGLLTIPNAVAVEFSPGLLINGGMMTQGAYDSNRVLYSTRISVATLRDTMRNGATRVAVGGRISLTTESSIKTDADFPPALALTPLTAEVLAIYRAAEDRDSTTRPDRRRALYTDADRARLKEIEAEIRKRWGQRNWNADIMDLAFACRLATGDPMGRDPQVDALSMWFTYAKGFQRWGQLLVGIAYGASRDPAARAEMRQDASLGLRLYVGSNQAKALLEAEQSWREESRTRWLVNTGFEFAVANWVWMNFAAGVERRPGEEEHVVTSFKLKTALPGL